MLRDGSYDTVAISPSVRDTPVSTAVVARPRPPRPSRDEILALGVPIVRRVAFRLARRLPPHVDVGDLIGAGNEGLLRAAERWDPERAPELRPYLESCIRGACLDELRATDVVSRHGRERMTQIARATRALESELGRAPEEDEIAKKLGIELDAYRSTVEAVSRAPALGHLGADPDTLEGAAEDPSARIEQGELRERLIAAIHTLPERSRQVLTLYYQEECTQAEIGRILGVTESRVCQILGESIARLRGRLGAEA